MATYHGHVLFEQPYSLTDAQWTTAVAALIANLNAFPAHPNPSHRLHYRTAGSRRIILEGEFDEAQLTNAAIAAIEGTTEAEVKEKWRKLQAFSTTALTADTFVTKQYSARVGRFVWLSDIHFGFTFTPPQTRVAADLAARINALAPDVTIVTGDISQESTAEQIAEYAAFKALLSAPCYELPGNHDEGTGLDYAAETPDQVASWDTWDAAGFPRHFAVTLGPVRIIGFNSYIIRLPDTPKHAGAVAADEIAFVTAELEALGTLRALLFSHFPYASIDQAHGGSTLATLAGTYAVKAMAGGHGHMNMAITYIQAGALPILYGPSVRETVYGTPLQRNLDGGFMVCDVFANRVELAFVRANAPWDAFGPSGASYVTDPPYTPIVVWL